MLLAHKVSISKWDGSDGQPEGKIQADAVTSDLRTRDNALSFWNCGDDTIAEQMLEDTVLAVACSMDRPSRVDLVWLVREDLEKEGHALSSKDVQTHVLGLEGRHVDVCELDYEGLGSIAFRIAAAVGACEFRRFREKQVMSLLAKAAKEGRLDTSKLKDKLRERVEAEPDRPKLDFPNG